MRLRKKTELSEAPEEPGIYRLFSREKWLVYLGRTVSFTRRLKEHVFSKNFEYFTLEPVDVGLYYLEKKYLEEYKEQHNGELPLLNKKIG